MLRDATPPQPILLKNYTAPVCLVDKVDLTFELYDDHAIVRSRLVLSRNPEHPDAKAPLRLDGEALELLAVVVDGKILSTQDYQRDEHSLTLPELADSAIVEITTRLQPQLNTTLMGLYQSSGNFFTQCEAEGFRRITYYLDRPDVMARFSTTIIADKSRWPVLLSNGNSVGEGQYDKNRHWVKWVDPFRKPAYLFALVAGKLACLQDQYITASGRKVTLEIYVALGDLDKCPHAMASLKKAMQWDEQVFGLEYDLDSYMIVAVSDFNMGAMENKGLNIFNTKYVLARADTATDSDFDGIEAVIAHEYFHNWTGNRVTCRDWFQLSLKEGLTVFRDQEFSADMGSRAVKRIEDVRVLRTAQFAEDGGPLAHPVRPDSYIEINNFYTVTIYEKGAEVVRMYHTLLGAEGFRRGMDLYFKRHDGQAVTCDDFRAAMADANAVDLSQFERWYSQAGTPVLTADGQYDAASQRYTLTLRQSCPATPGQADKLPLPIPVAMGLLDAQGRDMPLQLTGEAEAQGGSRVLVLTAAEQTYTFINVAEAPAPSLLRGFSAPVKLEMPASDAELALRMAHDSDAFNRWEAGQTLLQQTLLQLIAQLRARQGLLLPSFLSEALRQLFAQPELDPALLALMLTLPAESYLADQLPEIDPAAIRAARDFVRMGLAKALRQELRQCYDRLAMPEPYAHDAKATARRSLKNTCLAYLALLDEPAAWELAEQQYRRADNMTDSLAALTCLADGKQGAACLQAFAARWQDDALVLDKWFAVQAQSRREDVLEQVQELMTHPAFQLANPNKVRALIGSFCQNLPAFHAADGSGYRFVQSQILALDKINPQVAARLVATFNRWKKLEPQRRAAAEQALRQLQAAELSRDVFEIVNRNLF